MLIVNEGHPGIHLPRNDFQSVNSQLSDASDCLKYLSLSPVLFEYIPFPSNGPSVPASWDPLPEDLESPGPLVTRKGGGSSPLRGGYYDLSTGIDETEKLH